MCEEEEEGDGRERNSRVARTPKRVCHSVRQSAYSQAQTQVGYSICADESIYTHSAGATHIFSLYQRRLEISLFIPCHSLIRFHHHSNPSTFFSLFLPHFHSLPHCSTADLLAVSLATAASCLSVCVAMEEGLGSGGGGGGGG